MLSKSINKNMKKLITLSVLSLSTFAISFAATALSLDSVANGIAEFIGGAIVNIMLSLATAAFFWSVIQFIWRRSGGAAGSGLQDAKNTLMWSVVALFVMFSIWGIVGFFQSSVPGLDKTTISAPKITP
jgi:hypothetical protein